MTKITLNYKLLLHLFDAAYIRRWNDQVRTADFREIDKQAHKFIIAFLIGKHNKSKDFDWQSLIEAGIYEFFHRLALTDLKPQLFHRITEDPATYKKLITYSKNKLAESFNDKKFLQAYENYFIKKLTKPNIYNQIMDSANYIASREEFEIIKQTNPKGYRVALIDKEIKKNIGTAMKIEGVKNVENNKKLRDFIKLCGQLRFQIRWSNMHRVPKTSVLGHMLTVAIITYLLTKDDKTKIKNLYNNFFTGLFHDLPEALTRDIMSPLKEVGEMSDIIKRYEHEEMEQAVYPLLPSHIKSDIKLFTNNEFGIIKKGKNITRNGDLLKAVDHLSAYIEAYLALQNGVKNKELTKARIDLANKYTKTPIISGVNFGNFYKDLEKNFNN